MPPIFEPPKLTRRIIRQKTARYWRGMFAWVLAPFLIGLAGVSMGKLSHFCAGINQWIFAQWNLGALIYMPIGYALLIYVSRKFFPGTQGSGIPQAIAVIDDEDHAKKTNLLSVRILCGRILLLISGFLLGASIGHEGPMVQIGASIMHAFYGYGTLKTAEHRRWLVLSGGAAGIAATFNTPIGGIMFAMEELTKKYVFNAHTSTLLTVILSGFVSLMLVGEYTYFGHFAGSMPFLQNIGCVLVCSLVGGVFGGLFSLIAQKFPHSVPEKIKKPFVNHPFLFAAACGLVVALLGIATGGLVFGTGYGATKAAMEADTALHGGFYGFAKWTATLMTAICGLPGGLFAPTLSVGGGLGDTLSYFFPGLGPHGAIVVVVMCAYLAGMTQSPLTAFVITMEITDTYSMLPALMVSAFLAKFISKLISPQSFYHVMAERIANQTKLEEEKAAAAKAEAPPKEDR